MPKTSLAASPLVFLPTLSTLSTTCCTTAEAFPFAPVAVPIIVLDRCLRLSPSSVLPKQ